jgi:uncharacterized membrane protein
MSRTSLHLQLTLHATAIVCLGVMAGFFWTYSFNVNQAMLQMDGVTYATVQSALNLNVRHLTFFALFFGPPLLCALALLAAWASRREPWWSALMLAGALYLLGIVLFTHQVNLPLNRMTEGWNPQALPADWEQVRDRWNSANLWRTVASSIAFVVAVFAQAHRATQQRG